MDDKESIRQTLRTTCVDTISDFYCPIKVSFSDSGKMIGDKIKKHVAHIVSLLDIGYNGGLISQMNYNILKEEYLKLDQALDKLKMTEGAETFILSGQLFGESLDDLKPVVKDTSKMSFTNIDQPIARPQPRKIVKVNKGQNVIKDKGQDKTARQDMIMAVIKTGEQLTIKDIITQIRVSNSGIDCSEKTIQRDLIHLVLNGLLNKRGERRWSRYSRLP
jgi:hypothetical protein